MLVELKEKSLSPFSKSHFQIYTRSEYYYQSDKDINIYKWWNLNYDMQTKYKSIHSIVMKRKILGKKEG